MSERFKAYVRNARAGQLTESSNLSTHHFKLLHHFLAVVSCTLELKVFVLPIYYMANTSIYPKNIKSITTYVSNYTIKNYIASNSTFENAFTSIFGLLKNSSISFILFFAEY